MVRRWDRKKRIRYIKNMEWCKENNLTLDFRRGKLHIYDNDGNLLAEGENLNKVVKRVQKRSEKENKT